MSRFSEYCFAGLRDTREFIHEFIIQWILVSLEVCRSTSTIIYLSFNKSFLFSLFDFFMGNVKSKEKRLNKLLSIVSRAWVQFKLWLSFRSFSVFWRVIQSIWMCQCTSVPIFCSNVPEDDARWKLHWSAKLWRLASTPAPVLAQFPCLLVATFILIKKIRI